jgi:type I restriction enzyme, S subunit
MTDTLTGHDVEQGELPEGWESRPLSAVCKKVVKVDPRGFDRERFQYVDIGSIDTERNRVSTPQDVPVTEAPGRARQLLESGDTVFATVRPYLRKIAWIHEDLDGEIASTGFCVLRPDVSLCLPRFLHFMAISDCLLAQVLPLQRGVSYPAVRDKEVLAANVPIPPLPEQGRIVEILEDQLSRLGTALQSVHTVREKAAQFRRSLLHAAFTGALTGHDVEDGLPEGWESNTLNYFCEMYQPKTISRKELVDDGPYPVFGANGQIGFYTDFNHEESEVTVTCRGATCGTVNVIPAMSWITGNAMVVRPKDQSLGKEYLNYFLQSSDFTSVISGTAQPQITRKTLSTLETVVAPRAEQERIVEILEEQLSRLDASFAVAEAVEERSAALRRSLLHAAFTGRLTEEWREAVNV